MLSFVRKAAMPAAVLLAAIAACSSEDTQTSDQLINTGYTGSSAAPTSRESVPVVAQQQAPQQQAQPAERQHSRFAFPTGHEETSVLLVERDLPREIVAGHEFYYDIKVTNINHMVAKDVVVRDECATAMTLLKAEPAPLTKELPLTWNVGDLKPEESRTFHIVAKTTATEPFTSCASATFNQTLCLSAPVVRPSLKLTLAAPAEATPCDPIPVRIVILNNGTATARDIAVAYPLPQGWTMADGKTAAQFKVDALEPNQTREVTVETRASKPGDFTSKVQVTASPSLKLESAPVITAIKQAVLTLKAEAPEHVYAGAPATIKYTIANTGTMPTKDAVLEAPLPPNVKFVSATDGGLLQNGLITWKLEPIAVKGTRTVSLTVEPGILGGFDLLGTVRAYCASNAAAPSTITVFGIPALLLEVGDLVDPVPLNGETTYQIIITNQGSAVATNVGIAATLENQTYVSALGGKATVAGDEVTFEPIASIPAKGVATLKLTVKCIKDGDTRFRVMMTSDQLKRPVEESESTYIYR